VSRIVLLFLVALVVLRPASGAQQERGLDDPVDWDVWTQNPNGPFDVVLPVVLELAKVRPGHLAAESLVDHWVVPMKYMHRAHSLRGLTVRQALDQLTRIDPRYEWREVGSVAVMRPKVAWASGDNFLNRPIPDVEMKGVDAGQVLRRVMQLAQLQGTAPTGLAEKFDISVKGGTLLDLLNETMNARRASAWYAEYPRNLVRLFLIDDAEFGNGPGFTAKRPGVR
jgi:hypothetical protein